MVVETKTYYVEIEKEVDEELQEEVDWDALVDKHIDDEKYHINEDLDINVIECDDEG
jgi:hypothetical protein